MSKNKIILIGDGAVGSSFAFASTLQGIGRELGIIDLNKDRTVSDALDLEDALACHQNKDIYSADYSDCKDADIVVITAGVPQKPGETRLQLVDKNLAIFKKIVGAVVESGFNGIFLVASNPVDIMTYATWKFSGFPQHKVIGSGTSLDTHRYKKEIASLLNVAPTSVHGYILGEHGDSEFAAFSATTVGGVGIYEYLQRGKVTQEQLDQAYENTVRKAYKIINGKGATYYGIGTALARICKAILTDENAVLPVSGLLEGQYGLHDVYIGTPCVINKEGIREIIEVKLDKEEQAKMAHSAKVLTDIKNDAFSKLEE